MSRYTAYDHRVVDNLALGNNVVAMAVDHAAAGRISDALNLTDGQEEVSYWKELAEYRGRKLDSILYSLTEPDEDDDR